MSKEFAKNFLALKAETKIIRKHKRQDTVVLSSRSNNFFHNTLNFFRKRSTRNDTDLGEFLEQMLCDASLDSGNE